MTWQRAAVGLALAVLVVSCGRAPSADARARREIAEAAALRDTSFTGPWFAARYLHGQTYTALVGHVSRPAEARQVKTSVRYPRVPVVSHDGSLVVVRDAARAKTIEVIDVATDKIVFSTSPGATTDITDAGWGPGRRFWYLERPLGQLVKGSLHVVDIDSREDRVVVDGTIKSPRWSPDASRIAYIADGRLFAIAPSPGAVPVRLGDTQWAAGCLEWAPSGKQLAFCVWVAGEKDCQKVEILDPATGVGHRLLESNCISSLAWTPDEQRIAYPWGSQIREVPVAGGPMKVVISSDSSIQSFTIVGTTAHYFSTSAKFPATLWRQELGQEHATKQLETVHVEPTDVSIAQEVPLQVGDRKIPVFRYPRTCGKPNEAGPTLFWLPCMDGLPHDPQWNQEVQYLARLGLTIYVVDVYAKTHGLADVEKALSYVREQPDVRGSEVFLFQCCGSSYLGDPLVKARGQDFAGVIDFNGVVVPRVVNPPHLPPTLWITLENDPEAAARDAELRVLRQLDAPVIERRFATNHYYPDRLARVGILEAMAAFVHEHSKPMCE